MKTTAFPNGRLITPKEMEIMKAIRRGMTTEKELASCFHNSRFTIRKHKQNMQNSIRPNANTADLLLFGINNGIL